MQRRFTVITTYIKLMPCFSEDPGCFRVRIAADFLPAPCASQKQSSPPGPATSCHPSIHREVVRITDPGSSSPFCSQSHDARPGNPHRPRWRRHPLEHPPPALPPHPPAPGIPPPSTTLREHPWHWTYSKIQVARHLVSGSCACDSGPPPFQTFMRQKGAPGQKKNHTCWLTLRSGAQVVCALARSSFTSVAQRRQRPLFDSVSSYNLSCDAQPGEGFRLRACSTGCYDCFFHVAAVDRTPFRSARFFKRPGFGLPWRPPILKCHKHVQVGSLEKQMRQQPRPACFSPRLCAGFLFLVLYPVPPAPPPPPPPAPALAKGLAC